MVAFTGVYIKLNSEPATVRITDIDWSDRLKGENRPFAITANALSHGEPQEVTFVLGHSRNKKIAEAGLVYIGKINDKFVWDYVRKP